MTGMFSANVHTVWARIIAACARAGRDPAAIRLIAVTKTREPDDLSHLAALGLVDYGENRVEHLERMTAAAPPQACFHFIGRVQGRQFKQIVPRCAVLHSLASRDHVPRLERACEEAQRDLAVFCQINTGHDPVKAGCDRDGLGALVDAVRACGRLQLQGLMCMAPFTVDRDLIRACFATCREWATSLGLSRLSMGMTQDYEIAIEEGATDLRIGTALFDPEGG